VLCGTFLTQMNCGWYEYQSIAAIPMYQASFVHRRRCAHTHMRAYTHTHTHVCTHTHTHTHNTHTHVCTHTHTQHTHTNVHIHLHTHVHTHTFAGGSARCESRSCEGCAAATAAAGPHARYCKVVKGVHRVEIHNVVKEECTGLRFIMW